MSGQNGPDLVMANNARNLRQCRITFTFGLERHAIVERGNVCGDFKLFEKIRKIKNFTIDNSPGCNLPQDQTE